MQQRQLHPDGPLTSVIGLGGTCISITEAASMTLSPADLAAIEAAF